MIGGNVIKFVSSWPHLAHILTKDMNNKAGIEQRKHSLCGQINDVICYFGKRQSVVRLKLMKTYCTSFYGSVTMGLESSTNQCFLYHLVKGFTQFLGYRIPYCTHVACCQL